MLSSYRLPLTFDPELLKADLDQVLSSEWVPHFNKGYYEGEWKGLALRSTTGKAKQLYRAPDDKRDAIDTPVLERCPYFQEVLAAFKCPIPHARLLCLSPRSKIREHEDYTLGTEFGLIRIHIPIATDRLVDFVVGGERLVMMEGEAWYIDFSLPHSVNNISETDRVHLVLDCTVNEWLERMIPFGSEVDARQRGYPSEDVPDAIVD